MLHNVFNIVNLNIESAKPLLNQVKVVGNKLSEPLLTVFIYFSVVRNFIENVVVCSLNLALHRLIFLVIHDWIIITYGEQSFI